MMGVEIVAAVERQYQIKIDDDELAGFKDLAGGLRAGRQEARGEERDRSSRRVRASGERIRARRVAALRAGRAFAAAC